MGRRRAQRETSAGGVPAVVNQLIEQGLIHEDAMTVNGKTMGENCKGVEIEDEKVIRPFGQPLKQEAGFLVLTGNLFDPTEPAYYINVQYGDTPVVRPPGRPTHPPTPRSTTRTGRRLGRARPR